MKTRTMKLAFLPGAVFLLIGLAACKNDQKTATITILNAEGVQIAQFEQNTKLAITRNIMKREGLEYEDAAQTKILNHFFYDDKFTDIALTNTVFTTDTTLYAHYMDAKWASVSYVDGDNFRSSFRDYNNSVVKQKDYQTQIRVFIRQNDRDFDDPSKLISIYDHILFEPTNGPVAGGQSGWNQEHVWPKSKFQSLNGGVKWPSQLPIGVCSDVINLRACDAQSNSDASNYPFGEGGNYFLPDHDRGEVARILFYMESAYGLVLYDTVNERDPDSTRSFGNLPVILQWWNAEPEPNEFEKRRQPLIEAFQNNRNPFVEEPKLAYSVFDMENLTSIH